MPRILLAIETSNPSAWEQGRASPGVALARLTDDGASSLLGVESLDPATPHDHHLMPAIDTLLRRTGLRPRDLTGIAVSIGPGGYTAIRVAVTTAKLIAEATGARAIPVPSALVAAHRAPISSRPFAVAISSKGLSTFLTRFDAANPPIPLDRGRVVTADTLAPALSGAAFLLADRFLPDPIRARATQLSIPIHPPEFDPIACLDAAATLAPVDPLHLLPLYAREPEAVTKWRAMHSPTP